MNKVVLVGLICVSLFVGCDKAKNMAKDMAVDAALNATGNSELQRLAKTPNTHIVIVNEYQKLLLAYRSLHSKHKKMEAEYTKKMNNIKSMFN